MMQHFAKGNVEFMLDPRLADQSRIVGQRTRQTYWNALTSGHVLQSTRNILSFRRNSIPSIQKRNMTILMKIRTGTSKKECGPRGWHTVETLERAASFKEFLYNRPEKEIIVIASYRFTDTLIGCHSGYCYS